MKRAIVFIAAAVIGCAENPTEVVRTEVIRTEEQETVRLNVKASKLFDECYGQPAVYVSCERGVLAALFPGEDASVQIEPGELIDICWRQGDCDYDGDHRCIDTIFTSQTSISVLKTTGVQTWQR